MTIEINLPQWSSSSIVHAIIFIYFKISFQWYFSLIFIVNFLLKYSLRPPRLLSTSSCHTPAYLFIISFHFNYFCYSSVITGDLGTTFPCLSLYKCTELYFLPAIHTPPVRVMECFGDAA